MDILGVPIYIWHSLVVEEHTGIIIFVILALAVRVLGDLTSSRIAMVSDRMAFIHDASDKIAYIGSGAAVLFLILSGVTGYLIQPFGVLLAQPALMNKSLLALGSLFFWTAFFFMRYWFGPGLWERRGLYFVQVVTALIGLMFTAFTASIGAEITLGSSGFQPLYDLFNFNWTTFTIEPLEIAITGLLVVVGILLVMFLRPRNGNKPAGAK